MLTINRPLSWTGIKPEGTWVKPKPVRRDDSQIRNDDNSAQPNCPTHDSAVDLRHKVKQCIEPAEQLAERPVDRLNDYPADNAAGDCARCEQHDVCEPFGNGAVQISRPILSFAFAARNADPFTDQWAEQPNRNEPADDSKEPPRQGFFALMAMFARLAPSRRSSLPARASSSWR